MKFRSCIICLTAILLSGGIAGGMETPSSFDLRDIDGRSAIGPIRNQGACGSCYSFGALAAAESTWNRAHGLYDEQAIDLSESFLVWSLSPLYDGMAGCDGGIIDDAMTAMLEYGAPLEADFPYSATDPGEDLHWDAERYTLRDWYNIPPNDIETIKRVLQSVGAVHAAVNIDPPTHDSPFFTYVGGIFENDDTAITDVVPYYSQINHAISLVGWNDEPVDGGMGTWILRNSWSEKWGEGGYMNIRYTSAKVSLIGSYLIATPWDGESVALENSGVLAAVPWSAGGTRNAHGVDLWGGAASSVVNRGVIRAAAESENELATARGIYLWGGPEGKVVNEGDISGLAVSETNQAIAYGVCLQGGRVDNSGKMTAIANSSADQALAFGIWAANGGNPVNIDNSGQITAEADGSEMNAAYGIWADSRERVRVVNSGEITAFAKDYALGVLLTGGPSVFVNSGAIKAISSLEAIGLYATDQSVIINSGVIQGTHYSVYSWEDSLLTLTTGSSLSGDVVMEGDNDSLLLTGSGNEDESFSGVETLTMAGVDWSLSGDSTFDAIQVAHGRLDVNGALAGMTLVERQGILGGNGSLTGSVTSSGVAAPGNSVGHLTIDGDFSQSADGTLEIEIGDGVADRLTVTGSSDLAGRLLVLPYGYATGGSYSFLESGAITGAFDSLAGAAILNFHLETAADSLTLDVTRNSYAGLASSHNRGLAAVLDEERPTAAGDLASLLNSLDQALSKESLNDNMAALTPRIHGAASVVVLNDAQARLSDVRRHLQRRESSDSPAAGWIELLGRVGSYREDGAYDGMRADLHGLMPGVERTVGGLTLGAALAVSDSRYEARHSADSGESDSQQGYLYAAWSDPRFSGGPHLDAVVGGGLVQMEAERGIPFVDRKAESDHDGNLFSTALSGGYRFELGGWSLDPTVGLNFTQLREESFRERGADSADLRIATRDNASLQSRAGLLLGRPVQLSHLDLAVEARSEWRHEFDRRGEDIAVALTGGGGRFVTPGRDLAADALLFGVSLGARLSDRLYGGLSYDCDLQSAGGFTGHTLNLRLVASF